MMVMQIKIELSANLPLDGDNTNLSVFEIAEAIERGGIDSTFFGRLENRATRASVCAQKGDDQRPLAVMNPRCQRRNDVI